MSTPIALRVTVQPSTTRDDPARTSFVSVPRGRVAHAILQFPTGCNGRVHLVIEDREGRLMPLQGGDFALNGTTLPLEVNVPIAGNDPAVRLVAWADAGNSFAHTLDVLLTVRPVEVI